MSNCNLDDWHTYSEAAELIGKSAKHVSLMCSTGTLRATWKGQWLIHSREVDRMRWGTVKRRLPLLAGWYTSDEAGKVLGLSPHTVQTYCYRGQIEGVKKGRGWLIHQTAIDAYQRGNAA